MHNNNTNTQLAHTSDPPVRARVPRISRRCVMSTSLSPCCLARLLPAPVVPTAGAPPLHCLLSTTTIRPPLPPVSASAITNLLLLLLLLLFVVLLLLTQKTRGPPLRELLREPLREPSSGLRRGSL